MTLVRDQIGGILRAYDTVAVSESTQQRVEPHAEASPPPFPASQTTRRNKNALLELLAGLNEQAAISMPTPAPRYAVNHVRNLLRESQSLLAPALTMVMEMFMVKRQERVSSISSAPKVAGKLSQGVEFVQLEVVGCVVIRSYCKVEGQPKVSFFTEPSHKVHNLMHWLRICT